MNEIIEYVLKATGRLPDGHTVNTIVYQYETINEASVMAGSIKEFLSMGLGAVWTRQPKIWFGSIADKKEKILLKIKGNEVHLGIGYEL